MEPRSYQKISDARIMQRENKRLFETILDIRLKPQFTYLSGKNSNNASPRNRILGAGFTLKTTVTTKNGDGEKQQRYRREKKFASIL